MYLGNKRLFECTLDAILELPTINCLWQWLRNIENFAIQTSKVSLLKVLYKPLRLTPEKENEMTCRPRWHFGHRCSRILYLHIFIYLFLDQPILKFLLKTNTVWICLYNITIFKEKHGYKIRLASSLTISIKKRNRAHFFWNNCR